MASKPTRARAAAAAALLAAALGAGPTGAARAAGPDPIYAEAGIRYPEGFDVNTLADVRGRVAHLDPDGKGPVRFEVDTGTDRYTILASPHWFWSDLDPGLTPGDEVVVRGSKSLGTNGRLYVIAQELRLPASGRTVAFRDAAGSPMWTGHSPRGGGGAARPPGSMGPALGPGGGMGRMGNMGHR
ncbi:MAG: OB-fold nucleic acid binding domain-containing protein [Deferrisomatales bacterium]